MKKATATAVVIRKRNAIRCDVIKARGHLELPPSREIWRMQWDEYIDSRMKQFTVR